MQISAKLILLIAFSATTVLSFGSSEIQRILDRACQHIKTYQIPEQSINKGSIINEIEINECTPGELTVQEHEEVDTETQKRRLVANLQSSIFGGSLQLVQKVVTRNSQGMKVNWKFKKVKTEIEFLVDQEGNATIDKVTCDLRSVSYIGQHQTVRYTQPINSWLKYKKTSLIDPITEEYLIEALDIGLESLKHKPADDEL